MQEIAEIHPYAKMAVSILNGAYTNQVDLDKSVVDLVGTMKDMYELVNTVNCVKEYRKDPGVKTTLESMTLQTIECGYFIEHNCRHPKFCMYSGVFAMDLGF